MRTSSFGTGVFLISRSFLDVPADFSADVCADLPTATGDVDASFRDADAPVPEATVFLTLLATRQFGETLLMMYPPHYRTAYNNSPKRLSG